MAQTGIETVDIVRGICDEIDVEIVVAIDALAARSSKRLGCTIQLTDTGISPGSGVGNNRKTLSSDNLGRRVIAVGVPTVISVPSIIDDSLDEVAVHLTRPTAQDHEGVHGEAEIPDSVQSPGRGYGGYVCDPEKYRRASAPHQLYDI